MSQPTILALSTLDTKSEETNYLLGRLAEHGANACAIDMSLDSGGALLDGPEKLEAMNLAVESAIKAVSDRLNDGIHAVLGIGGGTGGEMAMRVMRSLPITFPKVLVTTLPFDPRTAVADSSIILAPTLVDICGLNATLREVLENVAAMTVGLCATRRRANACVESPCIGVTALGATEGAVSLLLAALKERGRESAVFHANGYGGAAFARFCERGAFRSVIDLTPHELTRIHLAGSHVAMPGRFSAGGNLPRIVLPGGLNFIGLGEKSLLPPQYLERPHYEHSGFFTHVKVTVDEMRTLANALAESLNSMTGAVTLIAPMGGFSHRDCPGGEIEDAELREAFLERAKRRLRPEIALKEVDAHIASPEVTAAILETLDSFPPADG